MGASFWGCTDTSQKLTPMGRSYRVISYWLAASSSTG
jgi:hypothetical protein